MDKIIISLDDLSDRQREIAEVIGIENYIKLSKRFGGEDSVYIQKYSEIIKSVRNKEIRIKYNDGHNISELAKIYNLSERYIRKLCHNKTWAEYFLRNNSTLIFLHKKCIIKL